MSVSFHKFIDNIDEDFDEKNHFIRKKLVIDGFEFQFKASGGLLRILLHDKKLVTLNHPRLTCYEQLKNAKEYEHFENVEFEITDSLICVDSLDLFLNEEGQIRGIGFQGCMIY